MSHPVDEYVGARIREERLRAGFSQEVLASGIGVKFQQVQKYEAGKNRVSCSRLWEISQALDIPIPMLMPKQGRDVGSNPQMIKPRRISSEEEQYVRKFVQLQNRERDIVMALISTLENK